MNMKTIRSVLFGIAIVVISINFYKSSKALRIVDLVPYVRVDSAVLWIQQCNESAPVVAIRYVLNGKEVVVVVDENHPQYNKNHPFIRHTSKNDEGETIVEYQFIEPTLGEGDTREEIKIPETPCNFEFYLKSSQ